jgi:branched-chain amino acid transport system permease protein
MIKHYNEQFRIMKSLGKWMDVLLLFILLSTILPLFIPRFLLIDILAWSVLIFGFNLLYGFLGYLSFGHLAYFAIGAYAFAFSIRYLNIDPLLAIIIALLSGALAGALFGFVIARRGDIYFALTNLSMSVIVYYTVSIFLKDYTWGDQGIYINLKYGIIDLSSRETAYLVVLIIFMLVFIFYKILSKSTFALLLQAIKEKEDRIKFLGYNTFLIKYLAVIISTSLSALGGAMLVLSHAYVSASIFTPVKNGEILVMSMLGGPLSIYGGILGSALYLGLKYVIAGYIGRWELFVGIILIIVMIFARGIGISGIIEKILKRRITSTVSNYG